MAGVFQRVFKVFQSEAHAQADKLEDPVKMTEQGIRDLKKDQRQAMESLAKVKSVAVHHRKDKKKQQRRAEDYERKAMKLLQRAEDGDLEQSKAERLAREALSKKEEAEQRAKELAAQEKKQQQMADQLQGKVSKLKKTVQSYENDLVTLRARAQSAESMRKINEEMAQVDSSGTVSMLERMRDKVEEEESLAEAYGDMAEEEAGPDAEIDAALAEPSSSQTDDSLADLKKKMQLKEKN